MTDEIPALLTEQHAVQSVALDNLAALVSEVFPKGTTDPFGKALRHQLHKAGRLNMVRDWNKREALAKSFQAIANLTAGDRDANTIANMAHDLEAELRKLHAAEYHR